jgi:hypothetical protein
VDLAMSEPAQVGRSADGPQAVRTRRKTRPSPRNRRAFLERSGLPRLDRGIRHKVDGYATAEARAWEDYLGPLVTRLGLGRPIPRWALPHLIEAGHSHLVLLRLRAAERGETNPAEARRVRSEARRSASQRSRCENVLAKMVEAHHRQRGPVSLRDLARG